MSLVLTVVAFATGDDPVLAAIAMAVVAVLTSVAAAAGPLGAALGFLGSLGYFLVAAMARVANLYELVSLKWAAAHIALGCVAGLVIVFVGTAWRRRSEPDEVRAARVPIPLAPMWHSLRSLDEHARDGIRRAIPLAILMYFFQREGGRDAFWIFFAAYIVVLTTGKGPKSLAAVRVGGALRRRPPGRGLTGRARPRALLARDRHPLLRDRHQPPVPDRRQRAHLDGVDPAGRCADRRRHRLGGAPARRHRARLRDRTRRHVSALAERQGDRGDVPASAAT
jgi:hypothetical protein